MKIMYLASRASHLENFHTPYISALKAAGNEVITCAQGETDCGVRHINLPFRKSLFSPSNIRLIFRLRGIIRRERVDLLCLNTTLAGFIGRAAAGKARCLYICHGYLFDEGARDLRSRLLLTAERLVRGKTAVLAVMNKRDLAIATRRRLGKRVVFINGMGLDPKSLPPLEDSALKLRRAAFGAASGDYVYLCAAEFSARKNQRLILNSFARLPEGLQSRSLLVFAGDGELLSDCKAEAQSLGISHRTVFLGQVAKSEMNAVIRACDCLVTASSQEGLPFNVMEALYCGIPAIATSVRGNEELVSAELSFPPQDAERLAELMMTRPKRGEGSLLPERYLLRNVFEQNMKLFGLPK